jgi:hypothetical protein
VPRYRDAWVSVTAVVATVGAVVALLTWTMAGVLSAFAAASVMGGGMTAALQPTNTPRPFRRVLVGAVSSGGGVVAAGGLMVLLGPAFAPVLIVVGLSSPPVVTRARRWLGLHTNGAWNRSAAAPADRPADGAPPDTDAAVTESGPCAVQHPVVPAPETLDDGALCWAWRRSYVTLQRASTPAAQLRAVQARQAYLDELERRNADGLSAWLASGARAAGDPTRFILQRSPTSPRRTD